MNAMKINNRIYQKSYYERVRLRIIFEYSPITIWEEDFSAIVKLKKLFAAEKTNNIREYLKNHTELVERTFRKLKIVDVNKAALDLYGAKSKNELINNFGKTIHKDALSVLIDEFASLIEGKRTYETQFKSRMLNGRLCDVALKVSVPEIYKDSFRRVIVTLQDISSQKTLERRLTHIAHTDGLTGLWNHKVITDRLENELKRSKRYHSNLTCLMIDLDKFKDINDNYGYQKGNQVLKHISTLIKKNVWEVDMVGRYGGDEFLVILPETPVENATNVAKRLRDLFADKKVGKGKMSHPITLSIGLAGFPADDVKSIKDLIAKTDKAMYYVKKAGGNDFRLA